MPKFELNRTQWKELEAQGVELARNTASALEFISETLRAESRYYGNRAYHYITAKLTGHRHRPKRDGSLDPIAGVGSASVADDAFLR